LGSYSIFGDDRFFCVTLYNSMHTLVSNKTSIYHGTILQMVNVWS